MLPSGKTDIAPEEALTLSCVQLRSPQNMSRSLSLAGIETASIYRRSVVDQEVRVAILVSAAHLSAEMPAADHFRELGFPILISHDPSETEDWVSRTLDAG